MNRHKLSSFPLPLILVGDFNSLARKTQSDAYDQVRATQPLLAHLH
jgi:endonuclease/exonuclease/phosphatase (EEP) superfamily protein YafD